MKLRQLMESSDGSMIGRFYFSPNGQKIIFSEQYSKDTIWTDAFNICNFVDYQNITALDYCPTEVTGSFTVYNTSITSFIGFPEKIGSRSTWEFITADHNKLLTSLEGLPKKVDCYKLSLRECSKLSSFKGIPSEVKYLDIYNCGFSSLKGIHKHITKMDEIYLSGKKIKSHVLGLLLIENLQHIYYADSKYSDIVLVFDIIQKYLDQPMSDERLEACREELIDNNFEEYALE